jgi:hypothetical protein
VCVVCYFLYVCVVFVVVVLLATVCRTSAKTSAKTSSYLLGDAAVVLFCEMSYLLFELCVVSV